MYLYIIMDETKEYFVLLIGWLVSMSLQLSALSLQVMGKPERWRKQQSCDFSVGYVTPYLANEIPSPNFVTIFQMRYSKMCLTSREMERLRSVTRRHPSECGLFSLRVHGTHVAHLCLAHHRFQSWVLTAALRDAAVLEIYT